MNVANGLMNSQTADDNCAELPFDARAGKNLTKNVVLQSICFQDKLLAV